MAKRDYYEVLGVAKDAEADVIKKAYRKLARELHPDVNKASDAEARFKEVKEAYDVLSDDQQRAQYDQFGHTDPMGGGAGGAGFGGFGDSVHDIFDMFFGGGGKRNPNAPQKGEDLEVRVTIEFKDSFFGLEKELDIEREETCDACDGTGAKPGTKPETCHVCKGSGQQEVVQNTPFGRIATRRTCGTCGGTGKIIKQRCNQCWGSGKVKKKRAIQVKIPAGIQTGSQLRMHGEGEKGLRGGPAGDLYVTIHVKGHDFFKREQDDVHCRVPLTFVQAALGDEIEVPTMTGRVALKVPPGTQSETTFRLKGKGFPHLRSNGRQQGQGEQYVTVFVVVPTKLTEQQKEQLRAFAGDEVEGDHGGFFERMKRAIMGDS